MGVLKMGPLLKKACFCISLKTGTVILGAFNLIFSIIGASISLALLIYWLWYGEKMNKSDQLQPINSNFDDAGEGKTEPSLNAHAELLILYIGTGAVFLICAFYIIITYLLIHGARNGISGLLIPWLIHTGISMVLEVALTVALFFYAQFIGAVGSIILLIIQAYLFLCVLSLRKELQWRGQM